MSIVVRKKKGETKDDLLNRFRKIFIEEEITEEVKKRLEYVKKARKKYEKKKAQQKNRKRGNN